MRRLFCCAAIAATALISAHAANAQRVATAAPSAQPSATSTAQPLVGTWLAQGVPFGKHECDVTIQADAVVGGTPTGFVKGVCGDGWASFIKRIDGMEAKATLAGPRLFITFPASGSTYVLDLNPDGKTLTGLYASGQGNGLNAGKQVAMTFKKVG